jgi:hypothetical protein
LLELGVQSIQRSNPKLNYLIGVKPNLSFVVALDMALHYER